jgi:hypothetical protein
MAHPDRGALSALLDGKPLASYHCFRAPSTTLSFRVRVSRKGAEAGLRR